VKKSKEQTEFEDIYPRITGQVKKRITLTPLQLDILYKISAMKEVNLEQISKELKIPKSTVYYNYRKLEEEGLIKGVNLEIDQSMLGVDITAITFVRTKYAGASGSETGAKMAKIPGVISVYYVLGDIDFIVVSKAINREDLKRIIDAIAKIEEVERTSTQYVLNVIKEERDFLANYPAEVARVLFGTY
jgi:DNA-binding Lrp family transcriptional regulator